MKERKQNLTNFDRLAEQVLASLESGRSVEIKASPANIEAIREGKRAVDSVYRSISKSGRPVGSYKDDSEVSDDPKNSAARERMRRWREKKRLDSQTSR